jgi:predicted metalloprotease with PDZ domain
LSPGAPPAGKGEAIGVSDPRLEYRVRFPRPQTHRYLVTLALDGLAPGEHRIEMAVWTPGSYLVREFSRHVHGLRAADGDGRPLACGKVSKNAWRFFAPASGAVRIEYEVYANEPTVQTSHLDASHAYWNGASMFFALDGRTDLPVDVVVETPPGWRVSTALETVEAGQGWVRLRAPDHDALLDSPVEVGTHRVYRFEALGRPHELALYGRGNEDPERLVGDLARIVETAGAMFGGLPYDRYVFIVHLLDGRGGGLEHADSTTCDVGRFDFRPEARYLSLLTLFSHEYFHLWNVKRIHPEALGPFDYGRENYTSLLWAMEGVTDYYAQLLLVRAGLWSVRKYAQMLASEIREYEARPGRRAQSAAEASFDTWIKFYRPDEDSPNRTISYYTKGMLIGLCLDLEIRRRTGGRRGLDDVLRLMYERYGRRRAGFPEEAYRQAAEEVAGGSLGTFWRRYVEGTEDLDPGEFLAYAGLLLRRRVAGSDRDGDPANRPPGAGRDEDAGAEGAPRPFLGLVAEERSGRLYVRHVLADAPAEGAGVNAGDEVIAVGGFRIDDADALRARVHDRRPGEVVRLILARRGELVEVAVPLGEAPPDRYEIDVRDDAGEDERTVYHAWLGQELPEPGSLRAEPASSRRPFAASIV